MRDTVPGFARMVKKAREAAGLSPGDLARLAGISYNSVYCIENETRAPSLKMAAALVQALGLKVWLDSPSAVVTDED